MTFEPIQTLRNVDPAMRPILHTGIKRGWWVRLYRRCLAAVGKAYESVMISEGDEPAFSTFDHVVDEVTRDYQADNQLTVDGVAGLEDQLREQVVDVHGELLAAIVGQERLSASSAALAIIPLGGVCRRDPDLEEGLG